MAEEDIEFVTFDGDVITKNDYRTEIIEAYVAADYDNLSKVTDFTVGSEALHLADVIAGFLLEHRELIDTNYRMSMIHTAEGEFLDNFGDMVGVHRTPSSPSHGDVTLTRMENVTGAINIETLQVATDDAISFILDDTVKEIPADTNSIDVNVLCEQEGEYTNVDAETIKLVLGDLGNQITVVNNDKFSHGSDIESDDEYRNRILLSPYEVPTGSMAWYKNVALTTTDDYGVLVVHDAFVEKSNNPSYDIDLCFKPIDWDYMHDAEMTEAEYALRGLFATPEYEIPSIVIDYNLATKVTVLPSNATAKYLFAVLTKSGYDLADLRQPIKDKVDLFNYDATVASEFSPSTLAAIIENEVEGVSTCRIVKYEDGSYTELVEPTFMQSHEVFYVDTTNLLATDSNARIVPIEFNLDLTPVEE